MPLYLGTFLIAFSTLALEVTLSRLLSVVTWYHLSFFAVSTAMLGMTAGATTVYLRPSAFLDDRLNGALARACIGYAVVIPFTLILLCLLPLDLKPSVMSPLALALATVACSLPFYFSGMALTVVLTKSTQPIGQLYASDLVGAALGCLFVLWGLELVDAPSLILLCSAIGVLAAASFGWNDAAVSKRLSAGLFVGFTLLALVNASTQYGIRPLVVKGAIEAAGSYLVERWNSFSRVVVFRRVVSTAQLWGPSPVTPAEKIEQNKMKIDGEAGTVVRRFHSREDIEHLRYDVTNVAYYLRPKGGAAIIGVGGGRDLQSALLFGHERVVGIDVNPIFIDLLQNEFRTFAGLADNPAVTLVVDEARSYLSHTPDRFSIIQMSLIDTWAATGAGAFSLSENALYTVEAWQVAFSRLADDGIFTVSRWHSPTDIGETGRVVSLAMASLFASGVPDPVRHIAMVTTDRISTLLFSRRPFEQSDLDQLRTVVSDLKYQIAFAPDTPPRNEILRSILAARSVAQIHESVKDEPLNYEPTTDENPYFFNTLRLGHLASAFNARKGVKTGNLIATLTLIALIVSLSVLAILTIVVPLILKARAEAASEGSAGARWPGAVYFALIGAGFMFVEIGLIQRLSTFLSHPVYALGVLLFTVVLSTGIGSLVSESLPLTRRPWVFLYPALTVTAIMIMRFTLPWMITTMITSPMWAKMLLAVIVIFPLGILLGFFFPTGMRLSREQNAADTPWYWALNGIFGVLCSALAVFFAIYFGISTNFYLSAVCYTATLFCVYAMSQTVVERRPTLATGRVGGAHTAEPVVTRRMAGPRPMPPQS